jgi:DNA-binding HxlR family transcriptional regulator
MSEKEIDSVIKLFSFIWKKWVLLIIKSVSEWCMCFSDIEKTLKWINPRILSSRLKELENEWFVYTHLKANTKNKTIYCLTEKWMCFSKNIKNIEEWIKKWENK